MSSGDFELLVAEVGNELEATAVAIARSR